MASQEAREASIKAAKAFRKNVMDWQAYVDKYGEGDVWVQNLSSMNISFRVGNSDDSPHYIRLPATQDPYLLTTEANFADLAASYELRMTLAKRENRQPILSLISGEDALVYYAEKAKFLGLLDPDGDPDIDAAMEAAAATRRKMMADDTVDQNNPTGVFAPPKSVTALMELDFAKHGFTVGEDGVPRRTLAKPGSFDVEMATDAIVHPRVQTLCYQVRNEIGAKDRMPEEEMFSTLLTLGPSLKLQDFQFIESYGFWKRVRKWAKEQQDRFAAAEEEAADKALTLAGHAAVARPGRVATPQASASGYEGPKGFVNAPFQEARAGVAESMESPLIGPDGRPLGG